jgi:hypothetical protein
MSSLLSTFVKTDGLVPVCEYTARQSCMYLGLEHYSEGYLDALAAFILGKQHQFSDRRNDFHSR